jgi:hypothetical protein
MSEATCGATLAERDSDIASLIRATGSVQNATAIRDERDFARHVD